MADQRDQYGRGYGAGRQDDRGRRESIFGSDDRSSRSGDDDRGFLSRAGEQVRNWLGGDDDNGGYTGSSGGYGDRGRYGQGGAGSAQGGGRSSGGRDHPQSWGEANSTQDDDWLRDDSRQGFGQRRGAGGHPDEHYHHWRDQQISQFDRDYEDYRRERQQQFHSDFETWRKNRQSGQSGVGQGMTGTQTAGGQTGGSAMLGSAGTTGTSPGTGAGEDDASRETETAGGSRAGRTR